MQAAPLQAVPRRVLLFGRSPKFEALLRQLLRPEDTLHILSWRQPELSGAEPYTHVVIAGFDYDVGLLPFRRFLRRGYLNAWWFMLRAPALHNAAFIYINTRCDDRIILSRYAFAKERLARLLRRRYALTEIRPDIILNAQGEPDLRSGVVARLIIRGLIRLGIAKTTSLAELKRQLQAALEGEIPPRITPAQRHAGIALPRTSLMDKALRFLQGRL